MRIVKMIGLLVAALMTAQPAIAAGSPAAPSTVYVMRHLPRGDGGDPPLTEVGARQAQRVADLLADKGIKAVFVTPTERARQTGKPLADRLGLTLTEYDPRSPDGLLIAVRQIGAPVLVVGHSNTVHQLVALFGGSGVAPLAETDYGSLWTVQGGSGQTSRQEIPAS